MVGAEGSGMSNVPTASKNTARMPAWTWSDMAMSGRAFAAARRVLRAGEYVLGRGWADGSGLGPRSLGRRGCRGCDQLAGGLGRHRHLQQVNAAAEDDEPDETHRRCLEHAL